MEIKNQAVMSTFSLDIPSVNKLTELSEKIGKSKSEILRDLIAEKFATECQQEALEKTA
jgi:predicted DNA-binding protein